MRLQLSNRDHSILLIEDDISISEVITFTLSEAGFKVFHAENLKKGRMIFKDPNNSISLIVLDLILPDGDGLSFCKWIRQNSNLPILMLTSKSKEEELLQGFASGADDYMKKPFSVFELLARIKSLIGRIEQPFTPKKPEIQTPPMIEIKNKEFEVKINGNQMPFSLTEFYIFRLLYEYQNQVCTREFILDHLPNDNLESGDRSIDAHIKRMRKKVKHQKLSLIKTVRGVGYKYEIH